MVDTGCSFSSTAGNAQYLAYCKHVDITPNIDQKRQTDCRFGIRTTRSKGVARITFPFNGINLFYDAHVEDSDVPLLLSFEDMDKLKLHFNYIMNQLYHIPSGTSVLITPQFGHPFYLWQPMLHALFTEIELRLLHRRFRHPQNDKLVNLLRRARFASVSEETKKMLDKIVLNCEACQIYASKPRRFQFTLRDDKDFNDSVYIDVFVIDCAPILHVVDEATRYQAARWLDKVSAPVLWTALRLCSIDVYLGPPDDIVHDDEKRVPCKRVPGTCRNLAYQDEMRSSRSSTIYEHCRAVL